ncbi:hypothetical protein [Deinococcus aerophilus]
MTRKGDCWVNAVVESLSGFLKQNLLEDTSFEDRTVAGQAVFEVIGILWNGRHHHSTSGGWMAREFERQPTAA